MLNKAISLLKTAPLHHTGLHLWAAALTVLLWGPLFAQPLPDEATAKKIRALAEDYKQFITRNKVECEVLDHLLKQARAGDARDLASASSANAGDCFFYQYDDRNLVLVRIGQKPLAAGARVLVAHHDSPCLAVTQNPIDNQRDIALLTLTQFQTVKLYQWLSCPLAIHGEVLTPQGKKRVVLGEDDGFTLVIPDLAQAAYSVYTEDEGRQIVDRETPKLIAGSVPIEDPHLSFSSSMQVLNDLHKRYGMTEESFLTADLKVVPSGPARDVGFSANLVGGFGHDGKAGCFTALHAFLAAPNPQYWSVCMFIDQNAVMSRNTEMGLQRILWATMEKLGALGQAAPLAGAATRSAIAQSRALVAEVTNGVNPLFEDVEELSNAAYMGHGPVLMKYLGVGGKYFTNDAAAEYMAALRRLCDERGVVWQTAEFGQVDEGGGVSLSRYVADLGLDVADVALPVLSMHAPFDVCSKFDLYHEYQFFKAFLSE